MSFINSKVVYFTFILGVCIIYWFFFTLQALVCSLLLQNHFAYYDFLPLVMSATPLLLFSLFKNSGQKLKSHGSQESSKLSYFLPLWLKFKSPILIYDSRAFEWLKARGYQTSVGDYASYYDSWSRAYCAVESEIDMSVKGLYKVK